MAVGVGSFSGVTTPMHYFDLDRYDNYVPHVSDEHGPLFDASGFNADTAPLAAFVVEATPTYPVDYKQLGYVAYTPLSAGVAQLGAVDAKLGTFIGVQTLEWTNFIIIQANNKAEIESIPPGPAVVTPGSAPFFGVTNIAAKIKAAAAAFASGKANVQFSTTNYPDDTVTYTDYDAGSFLSGLGSTGAATLTGVGTNAAIYSVTRNFSGGCETEDSSQCGLNQ